MVHLGRRSTVNPLSSVNFTSGVLLEEKVLRRNPLQASSQTFRRFMLIREMLFGWICIANSCRISFVSLDGMELQWIYEVLEKDISKNSKTFQNNNVIDLHDTNLEY